jgi:hypothetical protein
MNALEKLLKSKEQIDEEIEKEKQKEIEKETKERQARAIREAEIIQNTMDMTLYTQVEEIVKKMKVLFGDKVNDADFPLYLFALTFHLIDRHNFEVREMMFALESIARKY